MVQPSRTRLTADERREQLLEVALRAFAHGGLNGTSTEDIARDAGISHAYVFRLYGTKKELFLACVQRCFTRTAETFADAVGDGGGLDEMGKAYVVLLADRDLLLAQLQTYAACGDPEIQGVVRQHFAGLVGEVQRLSGATPAEVRQFVATGMLLTVAAAMELDWLADPDRWVR